MPGKSLIAVSLTMVVVLSVLPGGSVATERQSPTEIDECTTITEPGTYELTEDLEFEHEDCITVEADDVTIDGNGYAINNTDTTDSGPSRGYALTVVDQHNVTVRDVTFPQNSSVHVDDSTALTIENSELHDFLWIKYSQDITLRNNHVTGQEAEIRKTENIRLVNNHIDDTDARIHDDSANVTARDNHGDGRLDIRVGTGEAVLENNSMWYFGVTGGEGTRVEVTRNHAGDGGAFIKSHGVARVHNNTVDGDTLTLAGRSDDFIVTHNTVTNADVGVRIGGGYDGGPDLRFEHNRITNNNIGIRTLSNLPDIHQNDLSGNSDYGVTYTQDFGVVNATNNYWGDRPSSPDDDDAPFEDPETGTLANGSGSAVSEGSASAGDEEGVANVRFDPWLDAAPDAGVVDEQSDNDDSGEETTTTTTTTTSEDTTTTTTTSDDTTTTTSVSDDTTTTESEEDATTRTTTTGTEETTTTTSSTPTGNQTTIITGTTATDVPGFGPFIGILALIAGALLAARTT